MPSGRRVLVIGSQCEKLGHLSFLPEVAVRLHALMTDPGPGECLAAEAGDPPGLLLDPTVAEAKAAIKAAYDAAAHGDETLILACIGHGEFVRGDFYLMPTDAANPPNSDDAIHLAQLIKERPSHPRDGLIVLLDTCYSGTATWNAVEYWVRWLEGQLRFEVLTATNDMPTANAWFTRSLIWLLERGDPTAPEQLRCEDARNWVMRAHPQLTPQLSTHNSGRHLRLGRNSSKVPGGVFWKESPGRVQILERTKYYQPTAGLAELVAASRAHRVVILTGEAGVGKSTMAAALGRPEITDGRVPPGFAHALAMLGATTNLRNLAVDLECQLRHSVTGFAGAVDEFHRSVPRDEREKLDFLRQMVLRPLDYLNGRPIVRVGLDGLDQLPDGTRRQLRDVLAARPDHLRLIMTARDHTPDCPDGQVIRAHRTDRAVLGRYLEERDIPEDARAAIIDRAEEHWLIAQLLADAVVDQPGLDLTRLPGTVNEAYALRLDQAGAADDWRTRFRPVLGPLAVAGTGPILPLALLVHASAALGGPPVESGVLDVLDALRALVARRDPGTPDEHAGLFHTTLAEYLLSPEADSVGYAIDAYGAHRALATAIDTLAPARDHDSGNPLHRYARLREAEHWWSIGDHYRAVICLNQRNSNLPQENLELWRRWQGIFHQANGADDLNTLKARHNIAVWTGAIGNAREALRLFRALLPDVERVLGPDHPVTLSTSNNIASWTGESGDASEAVRLFQTVLSHRERALGLVHPDTLATRRDIASWTGHTGNTREALRLFQSLLLDQERVMGSDHPSTLAIRNNIASLIGRMGAYREALRLFQLLLPDMERVLGPDHPGTLSCRNNIAVWTGETGDTRKALGLFQALLQDQERILGSEHPNTLGTRNSIASLTGQLGDRQEALRLFWRLLLDRERVMGRDHPDTLLTRHNIAGLISEMGGTSDKQEALRLFRALLADMERVLGYDHPTTLRTRNCIAGLTGQLGEGREALGLFQSLLQDQVRVLGRDHPDTLLTRFNIAAGTGRTGEVLESLRLFRELLPDMERLQGYDHPDTLDTIAWIGAEACETGDHVGGCLCLGDGLSRAESRFGPDHPVTRRFIDLIQTFGCGETRADAPVSPELR